MDIRAVGMGIPAAGWGIRMMDILQRVADDGIHLVAVSSRQVAVADILRHNAVAVEEPYTAAEGSQPFCFILIY